MTGTITGSGYHDYELYYDPASDSIDFWVDGEVKVIDYVATTTETQAAELGDLIQWGSFDALGVGGGYWADVTFEVGPISQKPLRRFLATRTKTARSMVPTSRSSQATGKC